MRPALVGVVGYWARRALGVPVQSTTTDKEKSFSLSVSALVDLATAKSSYINEPVRMSINNFDCAEPPWISGGWLEKTFDAIALRRSFPRKSLAAGMGVEQGYVSRTRSGEAQSHYC